MPLAPIHLAKVVVAFAGIVCFGVGIRLDHEGLRWVGIGLVAVAWLLRFVRRPA